MSVTMYWCTVSYVLYPYQYPEFRKSGIILRKNCQFEPGCLIRNTLLILGRASRYLRKLKTACGLGGMDSCYFGNNPLRFWDVLTIGLHNFHAHKLSCCEFFILPHPKSALLDSDPVTVKATANTDLIDMFIKPV